MGYRWFAQQQAAQHEIQGYVRNLPDGTVEVFAQADDDAITSFHAKLCQGPRASRVDDVRQSPVAIDSKLATFEVRF